MPRGVLISFTLNVSEDLATEVFIALQIDLSRWLLVKSRVPSGS